MINLVKDTINSNDLDMLAEWIKTNPRLTKGEQTANFETKFSSYIGTKYSVFVNSGSSALLLMYYYCKLNNITKIVVPSLSWATDVSPLMQLGIDIILCECNLEDLSLDVNRLAEIFERDNPQACMIVSVLGLVPQMDKIVDLCNKYNVLLMEDCCESIGSEFKGIKLGNFGKIACYSFYFGHTISTVEGGMICTNDYNIYQTMLMLRSHGWTRDCDIETKDKYKKIYNIDDFNDQYTFYIPGFNVRNTDINAFLGILQLKKINEYISKRNENFFYYKHHLNVEWTPVTRSGDYIANFAFPIISSKRKYVVDKLKYNNIECRPLICGSMELQPFFTNIFGKKNIGENIKKINDCGFYIPNHHELTQKELEFVCDIINQ